MTSRRLPDTVIGRHGESEKPGTDRAHEPFNSLSVF